MQNFADPRSTAVDDCFCLNLRGFLRPGVFEVDAPQAVRSTSPFNPGARFDGGSTRLGISCIEDDEPRVLDPAIGVFKAFNIEIFLTASLPHESVDLVFRWAAGFFVHLNDRTKRARAVITN